MARPRGTVIFKQDLCKGCGLCTNVCPVKILALDENRINNLGYHPADAIEIEKCTGCTNCALVCPDLVITVKKY